MPARHLWWGIHDTALVHKALTVLPPGGWLTFGADLHYLAEGGRLPPATRPLLRQALARARAARFVVDGAAVPLPPLDASAPRVAN